MTGRLTLMTICALAVMAYHNRVDGAAGSAEVFLMAQPPVLDGRVTDDPAWSDFAVHGGMLERGTSSRAAMQTSFRIGYTFDGIWLGVRCLEPEPDRIQAVEPDEGRLWTEDSIEVFIAAGDGSEGYFQFIISAIGSKWSAFYSPSGESSTVAISSWDTAVKVGTDCWCLELKIPFELLDCLPDENEAWRFNLVRNIASDSSRAITTWMPLQELHNPSAFGQVVFKETIPPEERIGFADRAGRDTFAYVRPDAGLYLSRGAREQRITASQAAYVAPRLAPDSQHLLYHSLLGGDLGIWRTDFEGDNRQRLTSGRQAQWSPSGDRIVFQRNGAIFEFELESGIERLVTPPAWTGCHFPVYAGEAAVVFVAERDQQQHLYRVETGTAAVPERLFAVGDTVASAPAVCPDQERLVYQDGAHLHLFNLVTRETRPLTSAGGIQSWPVWSRDGRGLCYVQTPDCLSATHDLYYLDLESEPEKSLITRGIYPAFDWHGNDPPVSGRVEVMRGNVSAQSRDDGAMVVENPWFKLILSPAAGTAEMIRPGTGKSREIVFTARNGEAVVVTAVTVSASPRNEGVNLNLTLAGDNQADASQVELKVFRHRPLLEIKPSAELAEVALRENLQTLVIPDRLADDLVFTPADCLASVTLPAAPLMIGLSEGEEGKRMVLIIPTSERQRVELQQTEARSAFDTITITPAAENFFIGFLDNDEVWFPVAIEKDTQDNSIIDWRQPFQACWRFTVAGRARHSIMWHGEELVELDAPPLPPAADSGDIKAGTGLVYLYGRSRHTPLNSLTPMDILYHALGTAETNRRLELKGLRSYRTARDWVPWELYREHFAAEMIIRQQARVFGGIHAAAPGARQLAARIHDDLVSVLAALDDRLEEYRSFADYITRQAGPEADVVSAVVGSGPVEKIMTPREQVMLPEAELEQVSGWLSDDRRFSDFLRRTRAAADERRSLLTGYRHWTSGLRFEAGRKIAAEPERAAGYEKVRRSAGEILRNRHYLEADWRGEKPLMTEQSVEIEEGK